MSGSIPETWRLMPCLNHNFNINKQTMNNLNNTTFNTLEETGTNYTVNKLPLYALNGENV